MRRAAAVTANALFLLAWAAWFGGLLTLGAVTAPAIFRTARQWPGEPGAYLQFAGAAAGEGFRRFNFLALACGTLLLLAGLAAWRCDCRAPRLHGARLLLSGVALGITTWLTFALF